MADSDSQKELTLPSEPYLENSKLTTEVETFLKTIFHCFDEDNQEWLDKTEILSILIFGYPDTEVDKLLQSVESMLTMKMEVDQLSFKQLLEINQNAAKRTEAFKNMLTNMLESYKKFQKICKFLNALESTKLPVFKSELELLMAVRKIKKNSSDGPILTELNFRGVVEKLKEAKKVVVMAGAGISTSCGIPDFRTPGTGLYDNLQKYNLPQPSAVFELGFFNSNPNAFWELSKEIYPENFNPSPTHYFLSLLARKGKLLRHYTQNIDGLERLAGVPGELLVEAHGTYHSGSCLVCDNKFDKKAVKDFIFQSDIPRCPECNGLIKPDITFFGEGLPKRFTATLKEDFADCDLLLVMGTSLVVAPFCTLKDMVDDSCPRVLINMESAGESDGSSIEAFFGPFRALFESDYPEVWPAYEKIFTERLGAHAPTGFVFPPKAKAYRDVFLEGKCDETIRELCVELGWADELDELINTTNEKLKATAES